VRLSVSGEDDHVDLSGVGVWSSQLRYGNPDEAAEAAAELDDLGFTVCAYSQYTRSCRGGQSRVYEAIDRWIGNDSVGIWRFGAVRFRAGSRYR
jgi:hypothetical protein